MKPFRFGIIGEYQSGKSLLINCILRRPIATIGVGNATTHTVVNYIYAANEYVVYHTNNGAHKTLSIEMLQELDTRTDISEIDVYLSNEILRHFILTDMPGFGANEEDNIVARRTLHKIDFAILIAWNNKVIGANSQSFNEIKALKEFNIPYFFFLNCINTDRWRCDDEENIHIARKDLALLDFYKPSHYPIEGNGINVVNLMWYWYSICCADDKLIRRRKNVFAFREYEINAHVKEEVGEASNFKLINKLFASENMIYLELKREIKEEIIRLKDEICPVGTIQAFAFENEHEGWLFCDGRQLDIEDYPELFNTIGFTFGGDNYTKFQLPDLRGRFIRGWDNAGKIDEGRTLWSYQDDSLQEHRHSFHMESQKTKKDGAHDHYIGYKELYFGTFGSNKACHSLEGCDDPHHLSYGDYTRARHEHELPNMEVGEICGRKNDIVNVSGETRPKNIALLYCIKAKNSNRAITKKVPRQEIELK